VKPVPALEGTTLPGDTTQLGGAPVPQLQATVLWYPFIAVSVPLKVADTPGNEVSDGFAMTKA
jgi:hypothetical protein